MTLKYGPKTFIAICMMLANKGVGCGLGNISKYKGCKGFKMSQVRRFHLLFEDQSLPE